jgi:iron(III) transport system ATP-binding protein
VLLLDEPLSNLDARLRAQMGDEFRALQRRLKITTLYVTHDQEEAMALSDRVVVMQKGRILQVGAPETVYRRPANREVASFFGTPNLIEAAVTACRAGLDGDYVLTIEGANGRGDCRASQAFQPGETVLVMARPEDVALAPPNAPVSAGQLAWPGNVVDGVFRGARRSLAVETAGLRFNVECPATRAAAVGETVTLLVDADNAWALKV